MASEVLKVDDNNKPVVGFVTDDSNQYIKMGRIDDTTKGLKVTIVGGAGSGTVTSITGSTGILLTPNPITTTGTVGLATAIAPIATLGTALQSIRVNAGATALEYYTPSSAGLTVGTTTITSGTTTRILYNNSGVLGEYTLTGSGTSVVMATSPTITTPVIAQINDASAKATLSLASIASAVNSVQIENSATGQPPHIRPQGTDANIGLHLEPKGTGAYVAISDGTDTTKRYRFDAASFTTAKALTFSGSITLDRTISFPDATDTVAVLATSQAFTNKTYNGLTITTTTGTFTLTNAKTLSVTNTLTLSGTDSTTMTFPSTTATIARTDAAQTFTGTQTFTQVLTTNNAITASGNAATVPITSRINTVTNNSAATLTITLTTTSATDGQLVLVRVLDFSAAAQTITWVNTENSTVTAPTTSNGSTTLPLTVGFQYNNATSKWRCIASA
jgi:hypothetical protein